MNSIAVWQERLALRQGVSLVSNPDTSETHLLRRGIWRHNESLGQCTEPHRALLRTLAGEARSATEIEQAVPDGAAFLAQLTAGGWLTRTVYLDDAELYTVQPVRRLTGTSPVSGGGLVLSRFTVLHRENNALVVESPLAQARIEVHHPDAMAVIVALASTVELTAVSLPAEVVDRLLGDLCWAGLTVLPGSEESGQHTGQWGPHELWFHARSRTGNGGYSGVGFGRTYRGKERYGTLPARREPFPGRAVELSVPDLAARRRTDMTLTAAVEDRRSRREHDDGRPISRDQLAELLYRCARVRASFEMAGTECLSAPHPSGGSAYELELYPVVRHVTGLPPGLYHYDKHEHRLNLVRDRGEEVSRLLWTARTSAVVRTLPQVLIVISARFGRLMRTYEEVPYSLVLKHVGALYQTMYLTATSLGLAACGLGAGDSVSFTEATGLDPTVEGAVGEFILGSARPE